MDITPFNKEAEEITDYKGLVKKFFRLQNRNPRCMATRAFFKNEVNILGAFSNELLIQDQGRPTEVLVGQWKVHPGKDLYVRADLYAGLALDQRGIGFHNWYYDLRTDCSQTGFFHTTRGSGIGLAEMDRAKEYIDRLNLALQGYELVAQSRKAVPKELVNPTS